MKDSAEARYHFLRTDREQFLDMGRRAAKLTLPYLLVEDGFENGGSLPTPWQSIGSKGCNALSAKLMLSLFPINTTFFKLQVNDGELASMPNMTPEVRSEIDLSLNKMERIIMQQIAESNDRVYLHAAMKHLIVTGNALIYASKKGLKVYPLDRYVVARDGDGNVIEIITKEIVDRQLLPKEFHSVMGERDANAPGEDGPKFGVAQGGKGSADDAVVYTHVKLQDGQHKWHQECDNKVIGGTKSSAPLKTSPWFALRFNVCDGESYGRGRVEEFIGDLTSLENLMKALVEGSAAAAKVVFMVSPSATTKPQSLANAPTGAIIQGRPDDVGVVQVGKTADFRTVQEMIRDLTVRLNEAFLVFSARQSERTTAEEIRASQQQLQENLSGIYGNLTVELLMPYLRRKLHLLSRSKQIPTLPKGLVLPTVVAGLNSVGRGQDRQALMEFIGTIAQALGPEMMGSLINTQEFLNRLAAASGIESLGLIKTPEELEAQKQEAQQQQAQASMISQMGQLAKSPIGERFTEQFTNDGTEEADSPQGSQA